MGSAGFGFGFALVTVYDAAVADIHHFRAVVVVVKCVFVSVFVSAYFFSERR